MSLTKKPHILEKLIKAILIHTLKKNAESVNFFLGHIRHSMGDR